MPNTMPTTAGETERERHGPPWRMRRGEIRNQRRGQRAYAVADREPHEPAEQAEHERFQQKLQQDVVALGADRLADADLACPLRDRHEHDVHDADAADEQRDAHDAGHDDRDRVQDRLKGVLQLCSGLHAEIVLVALAQFVRGAQQPLDRGPHVLDLAQIADRELHLDVGLALVALQAHHGAERNQHAIILALAEDLALRLEQADDLEPLAVDQNELAERISRQRQLVAHLLTDHRDSAARVVVAVGQEPALRREILTHVLERVSGAEHLRHRGLRAVTDRALAVLDVHDRRDRLEAVHAEADQIEIVLRESRPTALDRVLERRVRLHRDAVAAEPLELLADREAQALDDRHHRDHGRYADDDTERGQEAPEPVRADRLDRRARTLRRRKPQRHAVGLLADAPLACRWR